MVTPTTILLPLRTEADGTIRIGTTRVTLDVVIAEYLNGSTSEQIAEAFDVLNAADIHLVIGYYLANRAEIDAYLHEREQQAESLRRAWEAEHPSTPLTREILQARLEAKRKQGGSA